MANKKTNRLDTFNKAYLSASRMIPSWVSYTALAGTLLFALFAAALVSNQTDVVNAVGESEVSMDFLWRFLKTNMWCKIWLGLMLLCFLAVMACWMTPFIMGLIALIPVRKPIGTISEEQTDQHAIQRERKTRSLSIEERINALKPYLADYFWDPKYWGLGTNYSKSFEIDLQELINKKQNTMALGHLAYILKENNWISQPNPDFKSWLHTFFDTLGLDRPSETSPSKYSERNANMSTCFSEVDKQFHYLLDRQRHPVPKEKGR